MNTTLREFLIQSDHRSIPTYVPTEADEPRAIAQGVGWRIDAAAVRNDYIRATGPVEAFRPLMRWARDLWGDPELQATGHRFYERVHRFGTGALLFSGWRLSDGKDTVMIEMSGQVVAEWSVAEQCQHMGWLADLGFGFTRLDPCIDLYGIGLDEVIRAMRDAYATGRIAHVRKHDYHESGTPNYLGRTLYLGKNGRNLAGLRVYDKGVERKSHAPGMWIRLELQTNRVKAQGVYDALAATDGEDLSAIAAVLADIVLSRVDFIERKSGRRDRGERLDWWAAIVAGVEEYALPCRERAAPSWDRQFRWLERQVNRQLVAALRACEGDIDLWMRVTGLDRVRLGRPTTPEIQLRRLLESRSP